MRIEYNPKSDNYTAIVNRENGFSQTTGKNRMEVIESALEDIWTTS